ncbi:MAG: hypothetical protein ACTHON_08790 [Humibacter sp.]
MSVRAPGARDPRARRLRHAAVALWLVGALLLALGFVATWLSMPERLGSADETPDPATMQIVWSLQQLVLPIMTAGVAAVVLPFFLLAVRSRLR